MYREVIEMYAVLDVKQSLKYMPYYGIQSLSSTKKKLTRQTVTEMYAVLRHTIAVVTIKNWSPTPKKTVGHLNLYRP